MTAELANENSLIMSVSFGVENGLVNGVLSAENLKCRHLEAASLAA